MSKGAAVRVGCFKELRKLDKSLILYAKSIFEIFLIDKIQVNFLTAWGAHPLLSIFSPVAARPSSLTAKSFRSLDSLSVLPSFSTFRPVLSSTSSPTLTVEWRRSRHICNCLLKSTQSPLDDMKPCLDGRSWQSIQKCMDHRGLSCCHFRLLICQAHHSCDISYKLCHGFLSSPFPALQLRLMKINLFCLA